MYRPLSSQHALHHTHKTPSYPNLTLLLQSSTTLSLVPSTRLHLPLQLKSLSKQLSWLILNKAAVLAHPQQGVLLQCQGCCPGSSSTRGPSTGRSTGWSTGAASPTGALLQVSHDNKNGELLWSVSAVETKHFFAVTVSWKPIGFLVHCYIWGSLALMSPKA